MAPEQRSERVTARLTPTERQMLAELAEADGIDIPDVLRMLIRRAHAERFPKPNP